MASAEARIVRIAEPRLDRIRIALQPVQQLLAIGGDDVELRKVHVAVDKPRDNQFARKLREQHVFREPLEQGRSLTSLGNAAILDDQQTVLEILVSRAERPFAGIRQAVQDGSAKSLPHGA
jgi:hypothetical protein